MPLHDWTRVTPNDYHSLHVVWLAALQTVLNNGLLPPGYFAQAEHTAPPIVPDILTLQLPGAVAVSDDSPGGGVAFATAQPRVRVTDTGRDLDLLPQGRRRMAVRHAEGRVLVAVIELVSPSNKADRVSFADLIDKSTLLLRQGVHLMVIDPFPPTRRDPRGFHAALWHRLTRRPFAPPEDKPLTVAAYVAGKQLRAFVEPLAVGDVLPEMPLPLTRERYVNVPLEATYQTAWAGFPQPLRPLLDPPACPHRFSFHSAAA